MEPQDLGKPVPREDLINHSFMFEVIMTAKSVSEIETIVHKHGRQLDPQMFEVFTTSLANMTEDEKVRTAIAFLADIIAESRLRREFEQAIAAMFGPPPPPMPITGDN